MSQLGQMLRLGHTMLSGTIWKPGFQKLRTATFFNIVHLGTREMGDTFVFTLTRLAQDLLILTTNTRGIV